MSQDIYIIGSTMIRFGKYLERSIKDLSGEALGLVLKDCGLEKKDIEAAWFSNTGWGMTDFQHCIRGQVALSANGLEKIPMINVENACASASTALHGAWTAIKAGLYDCVLAIGAEKVYSNDRTQMMKGFMSGTDVEFTTRYIEHLKQQAREKANGGARCAPKAGKKGGAFGLHGFLRLWRPGAHEGLWHHPAAAGRHRRQGPQ